MTQNYFTDKLQALKVEVLEAYKEFFRNSQPVFELRLNSAFASGNAEITGLSFNQGKFLMLGEDSGGDQIEHPLEDCAIDDLIYVLEQLHAKQYEAN